MNKLVIYDGLTVNRENRRFTLVGGHCSFGIAGYDSERSKFNIYLLHSNHGSGNNLFNVSRRVGGREEVFFTSGELRSDQSPTMCDYSKKFGNLNNLELSVLLPWLQALAHFVLTKRAKQVIRAKALFAQQHLGDEEDVFSPYVREIMYLQESIENGDWKRKSKAYTRQCTLDLDTVKDCYPSGNSAAAFYSGRIFRITCRRGRPLSNKDWAD
ncbi:hypothetical protein KC644_02405 [Candidatus Berkelbacteria bacterium]|nr:hypothetical protein [Candidatus Berkelbacteria bacterium]